MPPPTNVTTINASIDQQSYPGVTSSAPRPHKISLNKKRPLISVQQYLPLSNILTPHEKFSASDWFSKNQISHLSAKFAEIQSVDDLLSIKEADLIQKELSSKSIKSFLTARQKYEDQLKQFDSLLLTEEKEDTTTKDSTTPYLHHPSPKNHHYSTPYKQYQQQNSTKNQPPLYNQKRGSNQQQNFNYMGAKYTNFHRNTHNTHSNEPQPYKFFKKGGQHSSKPQNQTQPYQQHHTYLNNDHHSSSSSGKQQTSPSKKLVDSLSDTVKELYLQDSSNSDSKLISEKLTQFKKNVEVSKNSSLGDSLLLSKPDLKMSAAGGKNVSPSKKKDKANNVSSN